MSAPFVKSLVKKSLAVLGYRVTKIHQVPNPRHLWDEDAFFKELMSQLEAHTLVDRPRCYMLYQLAQWVMDLSGDVAEIGVYKGGTARLLAGVLSGRPIHLFDTFEGMPACDEKVDIHKQGDFNDTSLAGVKQYLQGFNNIKYYQGIFPTTGNSVKNLTFCLVHIDVDIYKSVMDCCEFFYPRMCPRGIMIFDDYGFISCPGAKKAVDDFFAGRREKTFYLPTGQCLVIKK